MLGHWKSVFEKGEVFGPLLTNHWKAFDCLSDKLIFAKLNACGFNLASQKLVQSYLSKRQQRTKINQFNS